MRDLNTPLKIAVLISGTGSNMVAIAEAIQRGDLNAQFMYVVASNPRAKGIAKAQEMGLDVMVFDPADYTASTADVERKMVENFRRAGVEYVIMAGYMRKCTAVLLGAYENAVVNLHPALLPKHKGAHAIQDAWDAGDKVTGITIHLANLEYDEGPIIYQRATPIYPEDTMETLEARIHSIEHEIYPYVLQKIAEDKVHLRSGKVTIDD